MYSYELTFSVLEVVTKATAPLTITEIINQLNHQRKESKDVFRRRVTRHIHRLEKLNKISITPKQTELKTIYYLISASIFDSKYKTDNQKWYNTRFNKNFLFNAIAGKEFRIGKTKQNVLGFNLRLSVQGGDRYSVIDNSNSILEQDVIYNETTPFTEQAETAFITHFTMNYEWYKKKSTQKISLKILNATNFKEFQGHRFNLKTIKIEEFREALIIPNISYKVSF